jgi:hypothetical protein
MGHPEVQGFADRIDTVFDTAERCDGYLGRTEFDSKTDTFTWGEFVAPPALEMEADPNTLPSTLSLWEDLESVAAFAYRGAHGEALGRRQEWFLPQDFPAYVAWWVDDSHTPTFKEAAERFQLLHQKGPSAFAFDFKSPFNPAGMPCPLDANAVRAKVGLNSER